jgi:uncharacterized membrane protein
MEIFDLIFKSILTWAHVISSSTESYKTNFDLEMFLFYWGEYVMSYKRNTRNYKYPFPH